MIPIIDSTVRMISLSWKEWISLVKEWMSLRENSITIAKVIQMINNEDKDYYYHMINYAENSYN